MRKLAEMLGNLLPQHTKSGFEPSLWSCDARPQLGVGMAGLETPDALPMKPLVLGYPGLRLKGRAPGPVMRVCCAADGPDQPHFALCARTMAQDEHEYPMAAGPCA